MKRRNTAVLTRRTAVRLGISAALLVLFVLQVAGAFGYTLLDRIEDASYDARLLLTLPKSVDPRIVIVDLDERTLAVEGWPLARAKLATLVTELFDHYGIRALGFDVDFQDPDSASGAALLDRLAHQELADLPGFALRAEALKTQLDGDRAFAAAIAGKPVVLGVFFKASLPPGETAQTGALCAPALDAAAVKTLQVDFFKAVGAGGNLPQLQAAAPVCGFFDVPDVDGDGIFRHVPMLQEYQGQVYPALSLALLRLALADSRGMPAISLDFDPPTIRNSLHLEDVIVGMVSVPVDGHTAAYVPFRGRQGSFNYVSATDVIHGRADAAKLKNAIVLVGTTTAGLLDARPTPVSKYFPGVEVHANLVSGMLDARVLQKAPYYSGIAGMLLFTIAALMALVYPLLSPLAGAALVLGLMVGETLLALAFWRFGHFILPLGIPVTFIIALFLAQLLYGYLIESRRSRDISKRFGQYVPPEIVEEMAADPAAAAGDISMAGENREMTVLFSDIRGFTTISEQFRSRPHELTALMNEFLGPLTEVIFRHRGTIDKYMGDAIMAFWGAPLANPQHALSALQAAMEFPVALRKLDDAFAARGWPPLKIGVGLNTGTMTVGNMGSQFRVAYTVLGDAVNLGSRLEGLTKEYGVTVMCSEFTRAGAPDWAFRELDRVRVKGKNEPVAIYEPLGPKDAVDPALREDLLRHRQALRAYRAQSWDAAERDFFGLSRSGRPHRVYELYLERIGEMRAAPPGADWDGATTFKTK